MRKFLMITLCLMLILVGCTTNEPQITSEPTELPATQTPTEPTIVTEAPETEPPVTEPPVPETQENVTQSKPAPSPATFKHHADEAQH